MGLGDELKKRLIVALPFMVGLLSAPETSCAASCPYGLLNDPYPGQCPRYTDLDGNGICDFSQASTTTANSTIDNTPDDGDNTPNVDDGIGDNLSEDYHTIPLSIIIIGSYLFTYYLFRKGYINRLKHRRLWNILLTIGYAGCGITGILLLFFIRLSIKTILNPSLTYWHAELAILMVIGTFIHVHLYWKPFKQIFR